MGVLELAAHRDALDLRRILVRASLTGLNEYNSTQLEHGLGTVSWMGYVTGAEFWEDTLQNWQSEFLAVGTMAVFAIYLRQRGSAESKPVGAPHAETETSG